jgi:hypothetical protein
MEILKNQVKEIMSDFDSNYITIGCCDYKVNGALLTHCYYDEANDKFIFTSGDMENDKHAEEIILNEEQTKEVLEIILECY